MAQHRKGSKILCTFPYFKCVFDTLEFYKGPNGRSRFTIQLGEVCFVTSKDVNIIWLVCSDQPEIALRPSKSDFRLVQLHVHVPVSRVSMHGWIHTFTV